MISDDDDEDEDDTEALLAELEQIKKERAEEKLRKVSFKSFQGIYLVFFGLSGVCQMLYWGVFLFLYHQLILKFLDGGPCFW